MSFFFEFFELMFDCNGMERRTAQHRRTTMAWPRASALWKQHGFDQRGLYLVNIENRSMNRATRKYWGFLRIPRITWGSSRSPNESLGSSE